MDTMKVAQLAQSFMAVLERDYPNDELIEVGIVVELREADDDNEAGKCHTPTGCSNDSRIYQTGIFQWALDSVQWSGEVSDEADPPDERPPDERPTEE